QEIVDQAVLGKIEAVLDEEMIGWAVDEVMAHLTGGQDEHTRRRAELEQELGRVDHRVERALDELLDAAELAPALKARVKAEQARKATLQGEIARLDSLRAATVDVERL